LCPSTKSSPPQMAAPAMDWLMNRVGSHAAEILVAGSFGHSSLDLEDFCLPDALC
jgi:hypothetical protein